MRRGLGFESPGRNRMTAIVQRPGREVVALETRVRLALAVPRGGVGNSNRAVPRTADARANRARPTPGIPEGCTRGRRTPSEGGDQRSRRVANALVVQFGQDVGLSNQRSAFKSRPERADRWQKSPCARPQSESMQVRVLPDPFCRSGSRSRSARLVSGRTPVQLRPAASDA